MKPTITIYVEQVAVGDEVQAFDTKYRGEVGAWVDVVDVLPQGSNVLIRTNFGGARELPAGTKIDVRR
jgi:hypothetical protein